MSSLCSVRALGALLFFVQIGAASAACVAISKPADFQKIRKNLAGQFCLTKDIDMSGVANFVPIGDQLYPFTNPFRGVLDGRGHAIKNLKIKSGFESVGLFTTFGRKGVIKNLRLVNVNVIATGASPRVGAVVGHMLAPLPTTSNTETIQRVHVSGSVRANDSALIGGIVGSKEGGSIIQSSSTAKVAAKRYNSIGGLVGVQSFGIISECFTVSDVIAEDGDNIGGLVGNNQNDDSLVQFSYSAGTVTEKGTYGYVGGLIGKNDAPVRNSFSTASVKAGMNNPGGVGGFIGNNTAEGELIAVFAAGSVSAGAGSSVAGLVGQNFAPAAAVLAEDNSARAVSSAYWDTQTTGQLVGATITPVGTARTTAQLRAGLPSGFSGTKWAIVGGVSYPYLKSAAFVFRAPLATIVFAGKIHTFVPIGQRDAFEYKAKPKHSDLASKAAAYTILARAIGVARNVAPLKSVKIDKYFWRDATRQSTWTRPAADHAGLGPVKAIGSAKPIAGGVVNALSSGRVVLLRGKYRQGAAAKEHWLLATSYLKSGATVTRIVANDPWTGVQVEIDPKTKAVVKPAGFPLKQFKVNGYQIVTLR